MGLDIARLLEIRTWRAFDVDDDGRVLAGSDDSGSVQLVELADGVATPLTGLPGACQGRYLPGERAVVVEHDDGGNERGQLSLLTLDGDGEGGRSPAGLDDLTPLVHDARYMHRLLDVLPGRVVYATNRRNEVDFDVVIRNVATGIEEVLYDGGGLVRGVAVSADARRAVITIYGAVAMADDVVLVDAMPETEAGHVRPLTEPGTPGQFAGPHWLGDAGAFVVATDADTDHTAIVRYDVDPGEWRTVLAPEGHDLSCWPSPDGRLLLVEANVEGASRLSLHTADGEKLRDVPLPGDGIAVFPLPEPVWSPNSRWVALSWSAPDVPGDVLRLDVESGELTALTDSAAQFGGEPLALPTTHRVPTEDGEQVPCFVYRPIGAGDGSSVLIVHGGPESQSRPQFNPLVQAMAANGHAVLVPNVRGSTGYGRRWYEADDVRRRLDSVADLGALHAWLPSLGLDPGRAALWGGSYGGYMVLAGLAFQPGKWAAGVDIVGISSLVTFLRNTSAYRRAAREREYGSLEHDLQFLHDASPLTQVDAIRAPLFVIHGANDPRVPLSEAEQLVAAVSGNGVECELRVYGDEGHGLAKRANRLDAFPRALAFLTRHLAPAGAEPDGRRARTR
ncbi:MAG TPA: alpha/beta fold hydrolase [Pseudonocardiaceae bacterium]